MKWKRKIFQPASLGHASNRKSERLQTPSEETQRTPLVQNRSRNRDVPDLTARIKKFSTTERARFRRQPVNLTDQLNNALGQRQEELARWVDNTLDESQNTFKSQLQAAAKVFNEQRETMAAVEEILDSSFKDQRFVTLMNQVDGTAQKVTCAISDRMKVFEEILHQEQANLEVLWEQWVDVQADITCLAVEILGPENIDLTEYNLSDPFLKLIQDSGAQYLKNENHYSEATRAIEEFKHELVNMYNGTSAAVREQQKTWRVERKKMLDSIKKAVEDFEGLEV